MTLPERLQPRLRALQQKLDDRFLGKQEIIRLMIVTLVAGENMLLVGPPGTGKSALVQLLAKLVEARHFEYLLTRFSEPNELFGPVDIKAFREGEYHRRTARMLPEAEVVFLDEIGKASSAILNTLLTVLNERRLTIGSQRLEVPLISLFGATNEVPNDDTLMALFDRFLLRVYCDNLDSFHFAGLVRAGLANESARSQRSDDKLQPVLTAKELQELHREFHKLLSFSDDFVATYKGLIFQIRSEGISVSDRRVIRLMKLFAASAIVGGRSKPNDSDFDLLKHIWNQPEQRELIDDFVAPVLERHYRQFPQDRPGRTQASLDDLLAELKLIRETLAAGESTSDIQFFAQLKNLGEIRATLASMDGETPRRMLAEVDRLLESVLGSSKLTA